MSREQQITGVSPTARRAVVWTCALHGVFLGACTLEVALFHDLPEGCTPRGSQEMICDDGLDDDCDGATDCADSDCEGLRCDDAGTSACHQTSCQQPFPTLPTFDEVRVRVRGDTALIDVTPVVGAKDYRVFPLPSAERISIGEQGEITIADAVYRCGGTHPLLERDLPGALSGWVDVFYDRAEAEAVLGYVFTTAGPGRLPVYRLADPRPGSEDLEPSPYAENRNGEYIADPVELTSLVSQGWRDDGVAFYVPEPGDGTHWVYRWESHPRAWKQNRRLSVHVVDGPERQAFEGHPVTSDLTPRFAVFSEPAPGSQPLYRVAYEGAHDHDILVAGEARRDEVIHQGNRPVRTLTWSGLKEPTTLVVEALDLGCPYLGPLAPALPDAILYGDYVSMEDARLATTEIFINGQDAPSNRPQALARQLVVAVPEPLPPLDWSDTFDDDDPWPSWQVTDLSLGSFRYVNDLYDVHVSFAEKFAFGRAFGELWTSLGDWGGTAYLRISPNTPAAISPGAFLYVRMETTIPATLARMSQLLVSTVAPPVQPNMASGATILVQMHGHESLGLELALCDHLAWEGVYSCPVAEQLYGRPLGDDSELPWAPLPVLGDLSGHDRRVLLEAYVSTERVYLFIEHQPAGCVDLPALVMPPGPVSVNFGSTIINSAGDSSVTAHTRHHYFWQYSPERIDRHLDNLGINNQVPAPTWNESVVPCSPLSLD